MFTTEGKTFIKRYLAGQAGTVIGAISVGIGSTAAALGDTRLEFEFGRIPVDVTAYDFENDRLVFKGTLPEELYGQIYEVGLWTDEVNAAAGSQEAKILTSFDSESEVWSGGSFASTNTRIGVDSLVLAPGASATASAGLTGLNVDLIDYSSGDSFVLAYHIANANTANLKVRFRNDSSNYYEFTVTSPTSGYKTSTFLKGSATTTGSPTWGDISEIYVYATATAGGTATVTFDGLRVEDTDSVAPEYGLIARYIPAVPIAKVEGFGQDIEYALAVTV